MEFSSEQLALQSVWRRALQTGGVELVLPTESDATRMRFNLYNAVRAVRKGIVVDAELSQAMRECSVSKEGRRVTVSGKLKAETMQAVLQALGMTKEELLAQAGPKTAEEVEIEASQARLLAKLQAPEEPEQHYTPNPYYNRNEG